MPSLLGLPAGGRGTMEHDHKITELDISSIIYPPDHSYVYVHCSVPVHVDTDIHVQNTHHTHNWCICS